MKRHARSLAVVAPLLGLIVWLAMAELSPLGAEDSAMEARSATRADIGRTRELPDSGPVAAPDGPTEMMMSFDHVHTMMPHLDPLIDQMKR